RDALDERLLGEEEQHDDGQAHEQRAAHEQRPCRRTGAGELLQPDGERVETVVSQIDERVEEIGPGPDEDEQRSRRQGGARQWQDDAREDLPFAGAIYARGVADVAGYRRVE